MTGQLNTLIQVKRRGAGAEEEDTAEREGDVQPIIKNE